MKLSLTRMESPGLSVSLGKIFEYRLRHGGHGAQMSRAEVALRDHDGVAVEDRRRKVVAFANAFREGRVPQGDAELIGNRNQRVPDHGEGNGIDAAGFHCAASFVISMMI